MASRSWVFTLNNPNSNELPVYEHERYVIWQKERGENGTTHIQGYIELRRPQRMAALRRWLPRAHFEPRRGTREQARDYCRKEDTRVEGPFERGEWDAGGAGARNDLAEIKRKLDANVPESEIASEHFGDWLRYYKGFREYKKIKTSPRDWKTEVRVYWGETGTGKSRRCREEAPQAYWKTRDEWWDAYDGQDTVVIDDFYGWLPYDFMLRLLDRYPLDVPAKGSHRRFVARTILITSNKSPSEWYPNLPHCRELLRRIDHTIHFNQPLINPNP